MTTYAKESAKSSYLHSTDEMRNKLGLLTFTNAEINFDNCVVPKKNLLGLKGQGLNIAYSALIDGGLSVARWCSRSNGGLPRGFRFIFKDTRAAWFASCEAGTFLSVNIESTRW